MDRAGTPATPITAGAALPRSRPGPGAESGDVGRFELVDRPDAEQTQRLHDLVGQDLDHPDPFPRRRRVGQTVAMELIEIEEKRRVTREEAAKWLHHLADSLERHNEVEFVREGLRMRIEVPNQVEMEVELELGDDENGLEIELTW